jgi:hypothetical protein
MSKELLQGRIKISKQVPIRAVFHLLTIFVNVVDPEDIRICLTRFSNTFMCSSSTRKKATAVRSLVCSFCRFQTPSLVLLNASWLILILGSIRTSNPHLQDKRGDIFRKQFHSPLRKHHNHNLKKLFTEGPSEATKKRLPKRYGTKTQDISKVQFFFLLKNKRN